MSGFVYLWYDRKHKRYYIGSHWGSENDRYICSSPWMRRSYHRRTADFKRRVIARINTSRRDLLIEEERWLQMMKPQEMKPLNPKPRYYNLNRVTFESWHTDPEDPRAKAIGEKISRAKAGKKSKLSHEEHLAIGKTISAAKLAKRPVITIDQIRKLAERKITLPEICEILGTHDDHIREVLKEAGYKSLKQFWPKPIQQPGRKPGEVLKQKWADPEWRANQRRRLSEGAKSRPPRSEESKMKARLAQLGKPKPRRKPNSA